MKLPTPAMLAVVMPPKSGSKKEKVTAAEPTPATADERKPTPAERVIENAHHSKVRATADWVDGHITNAKHKEIHARADKVIKNKGRV